MLETLNHIDQVIFLFINVKLANPVTDLIMPVITTDMLLRILYGVAMILLLWRGNKRLRWMVLFSALVLLFTDQVSSHYLKHWIGRPRPCHTLTDVHLLVGCGGGFSMPSSHAANSMGQAAFFACLIAPYRWYFYAFAGLIAISRVFVGVHYPFDVLVGTCIGLLIGWMIAYAFGKFEARYLKKPEEVSVATHD
jgi:undecaprenyl-diphosphatase